MRIPRRALLRTAARALRLAGAVLLVILALTAGAAIWGMVRTPVERPAARPVVNDVTQLNPIAVDRVITPTSTEAIVAAVRAHPGPIAIGGGRYSMGGQTATEGALHIDMRRFNRILDFSPASKTITVQAGTRWRQIQERIDSANLSVKVMQTYANFTVGGSLSVNVHGRYVGLGPLILSVKSLTVVLADGSVVEASPARNPDIFYGVVGGYGGLGVITEATLELADNVRVRRRHRVMPVAEYKRYFFDHVRNSDSAVFHNADLYPDDYATVNAVTYSVTDDPVTAPDRLIPANQSYRLNRLLFWIMSEWPFGKAIRQHLVDPILFAGQPVSWRNHEASYDVAELEPASRESSTYVLEEYFVPVERFDEFVPKLRDVLRRHRVNVINVSIRHAKADAGALLAWARTEVFAFVLYYKQRTDAAAREQVGTWTRDLIDAALSVGGSYYLPYQPHATNAQFLRAYPRAPEFFALKARLDPTNKFRNKLWDRYYAPVRDPATAELTPEIRARLDSSKGYRRDEGQTFLTHPEWYIVYSSDEYAEYLRDHLPTDFPYVASIGQYWTNYREVVALTRHRYPFNWGYQVMLWVIGTSYSAELTIKALYENTVGRFSGWTAGHALSDEDHYAWTVAADYGRFIHVRPWYEYAFFPRLRDLWGAVPLWGEHPVRKWERKFFLSAEYGIKAVYAGVIEAATRAAYTPEDDRMQLVVTGWSDTMAGREPGLLALARLDSLHTLVAGPRYDGFRDLLRDLARARGSLRITEIAGNDEIFVSGLAPATWAYAGSTGAVEYALPLPTDPSRKRVALRLPVRGLLPALGRLDAEGRLAVDHIYDY
ncbi:MAG TPA: FAD-binding oxidoreductase [Gemmatimonadales bacterium]|nr:FAD-binding oxidoreductase [Gemmatimonadales bacterium]